MTKKPVVADISHHNFVSSFKLAKAGGLLGIIHKASQGTSIPDKMYESRRPQAIAAGLMWGAYHFNDGEPVAAQVKQFLDHAKPDADTLCCLDFEDNRTSQMSMKQAIEFLRRLDDAIGRRAWIYSGNRMKEEIAHALPADRAFLAQHPLWLCEYGPRAKMLDKSGHPLPWGRETLWQYTGDAIGPEPHTFAGFQDKGLDLNCTWLTESELRAIWAGPPLK